jgi:hypothetical protein
MRTSAIATVTVIGTVLGLALLVLAGVWVFLNTRHHEPSCNELRQEVRAAVSASTTPVTPEEYKHNRALTKEFMDTCFPNAQ